MDQIIHQIIKVCIYSMELIGAIVIVVSSLKAFYWYVFGDKRDDTKTRLYFAKSLAFALEFKLGGEILRTVVVRDWQEIGTVGAIIILRGILNFIIHWEIQKAEDKGDA